ncbi:MAG TPA: hypothetical protein VK502_00585, partial [Candidatus Saccharimonadales bacterium]|nr:hypothetical protein [Candidatus Saccharimonadales bacterium]
TTTYTVNANRNDTVSVSIKAKNSTGTSPAGLAAATIPPWYACPLQNGWNDFGAQFAPASYTKTNTDIVMLKGIIKDGTTTGDTVVCTLPVGYRPTARIMFQVASNNGPARVDVFPTGEVAINFANNAWLALDTINFVASTASYPWTPLPRSNGWLNFDSGFSQIQSNIDSLGRVHVQGLLKSGTNTDPTTVATLPVGSQSPQFSFIPAAGGGGTFNYTVINNNRTISTKGVVNSPVWYSIQSMFYPASFGSWNPLTLQNSWTLFDPAYSTPQYAKGTDGIVKVKGMIKSGNTGAGIVIANLPVGYRPKETLLIHSVAWGAYARVDVQPNGDVTAQGVNSGWTSLDAITFIAEQ